MDALEILTCLSERYALGKMQEKPTPVEGGLLHRMYHMVTDQGHYAVKLLNPDIMKRPEALENMVNSERIAEAMSAFRIACASGHRSASGSEGCKPSEAIPAVSALKFQGQHLLFTEQNNSRALFAESPTDTPRQYAFVYPWLEARSLFAPKLGITHCRRVGHILGLMHRANIQPGEIRCKLERKKGRRPLYNWQNYLTLAREQQVSWLSEYESMLPDLCRWDQAAVASMDTVHSCQVISHRDLDPKNIIWKGHDPYLIDWEAAGYVNPYQELLEVLHYWGFDDKGCCDQTLCQALLQEYRQFVSLREVDWGPVFACSYDGMLGWLEYTLKISLGLEGDEKSRGVQQMLSTCKELRHYEAQTEKLRQMLIEFHDTSQ